MVLQRDLKDIENIIARKELTNVADGKVKLLYWWENKAVFQSHFGKVWQFLKMQSISCMRAC